MGWRRRDRWVPPQRPTDDSVSSPDLATVFLITVWLREWSDDLTQFSRRYDRRDSRRQSLEAIAGAVSFAASQIAEGELEPGGHIYERLTQHVIAET